MSQEWEIKQLQYELKKMKECFFSAMNDLSRYKHIEEELGVDLITLFDILKNGYRDIDGRLYERVYLDVEGKELFKITDYECTYYVSSLSQCKKKEALE